MAKTAWGIELGTSSVKAVKVSGDRGGVSLEEVSITSLAEFGLGAGASKSDASAAALQDLRVTHGIKKGDEVYVSISGQSTLGRIISLPPVPPERIRETIENEARSQIPIKLEEAVWDYQVIEDDEDPDELRVNLYAAKRDVVDEIVDMCVTAGLHITGIQVAPLGIYNYIKYEMDDAVSDSCVAIDIGADNTDVIIIDGQKTYVRVVPVAGNDITRAVRARFKLGFEDAEKLKRRAHRSKDAGAVFEAMKPPLKEMVGEIYRAVGFYKSQHEDANINQLVMMGNGSKLLNIKKFFEQQLQYQVHKVDTPVRIALSRSVDPTEVQNNIQSLAVAIGLALQGVGLDEVNAINLIPREYVVEQERTRLRVPFYAAGGIAAAGGLIALVLSFVSTMGLDPVLDTATATAGQSSNRKMEFASLTDFEADNDKVYSLKNLTEGVVARLEMEDEFSDEPRVRQFRLRANGAPALLTRVMQESLAEYARRRSESPIYYATVMNVEAVDELPDIGSPTAVAVRQHVEPEWRSTQDGEGGYYTATRTLECRVRVATLLNETLSVQAAYEDLSGALTGDGGGILGERFSEAVIEELRRSGQLDDLSDQQIGDIDLDGHYELSVNRALARVVMTGEDRDHFEIGDMVLDDAEFEDTGVFIPRPFHNDARFAVNEVLIRLTLTPVLPSGSEEE